MNAQEFAGFASASLDEELLRMSGRVLYSEEISLQESTDVYYLGINPRDAVSSDDPDHHSRRWIWRDLDLFAAGRTSNAFLDESWKGLAPGSAELQLRVQKLLEWAGMAEEDHVRRTPCSNVSFPRTVEQPETGQLREWARACWPVHALLIEALGIRRILVGGAVAGRLVVEALGGNPRCPTWSDRVATANYSLAVHEIGSRVVFVLPPLPRWKSMETLDADLTRSILQRWG